MITNEQCASNEPQQPHCFHLYHWHLVIGVGCGENAALRSEFHLGNIQEETDYTQIQYKIYTLQPESFVLFVFAS